MPKFEDRRRMTLEDARKSVEMLSETTSRTCHLISNGDRSYSVFSHSELMSCDYCAEEALGVTEHVAKEDIFVSVKCSPDADMP